MNQNAKDTLLILGSGFSVPRNFPTYSKWNKQVGINFRKYIKDNNLGSNPTQSKNEIRKKFTEKNALIMTGYLLFNKLNKYEDFTIDDFSINDIQSELIRKYLFEDIFLKDFAQKSNIIYDNPFYEEIKEFDFLKILYIYTFNYDLVLEYHLGKLYRKEKNTTIEDLKNNRIFHIHGKIDDAGIYTYAEFKSCINKGQLPGNYLIGSKYLGTVQNKGQYIAINNRIIKKIIIIGFGFDNKNMKNIQSSSFLLENNTLTKIIIIDPIYKSNKKIITLIQNYNPSMRKNFINIEVSNEAFISTIYKIMNILFIPKKIEGLSMNDWKIINE